MLTLFVDALRLPESPGAAFGGIVGRASAQNGDLVRRGERATTVAAIFAVAEVSGG